MQVGIGILITFSIDNIAMINIMWEMVHGKVYIVSLLGGWYEHPA